MAPALGMTLLLAFAALPTPDPQKPPVAVDSFKPDPAWKPLDKKGNTSIWFDPEGKRLILRAKVSLRDGSLEHLLCLTNTKEHESILATDVPPRLIHAGLLLTGAEPGHPVRFQPSFEPPAGTPVAVELEWEQQGKTRHANARDWVKREKDGVALDQDWVFAGSSIYTDPETKRTFYTADGGDLFTVANFPSAILDLPFASSDADAGRSFAANTGKIPPVDTFVTMILHPAKPKSKPADPAKPNSKREPKP